MTTEKPEPGATIETVFWQLHDGNISWHIREWEHAPVVPARRPLKLRWLVVIDDLQRLSRKR